MTLQATLKRVDYAFNRWLKGLAKRSKYKSIKHYSGWTLDERVHHCHKCGFTMDRDLAAALVMLLWALGILPGFGTSLVDANVSTSETFKRKQTGSMKQLGQMKRQKHSPTGLVVETRDLNEVGLGSSS